MQPLRNENTLIQRGTTAFDLAGVNDISGESHSDAPISDRALAGRIHRGRRYCSRTRPVQVEEAAGVGSTCQLSGHTHGGQMWPFHYMVRLAQPSLAGCSPLKQSPLYVTGARVLGPPVRIGAPPDITVLWLEGGV